MTSVLLVNPLEKSEVNNTLGIKVPPLGLMYVAGYLEDAGVKVGIYDANLMNKSPEETAYEVKARKPDLVGITAVTPTVKTALKTMTAIRAVLPDAISVMGGAHATFMPLEVLHSCPALDAVAIGEAEETFLDMIRALEGFSWKSSEARLNNTCQSQQFTSLLAKIPGVAFRDYSNPRAIRTTPQRLPVQNLDSLPFPARHLVPFAQYGDSYQKMPVGTVITSRGCPFGCDYCSSSRMAGVGFRCRSAANVMEEVETLREKYRIRQIEFLDDIFMLNRKRAIEIAQEVKERKLDIYWFATSRVDNIDKALMGQLKKGGMNTLFFGVESGSQRVLNLMNKRTTLGQIRSAFKAAQECGIDTFGSFMFGYPGETLAEMRQTIKFSMELKPDYAQFAIVTPFPGTPIYDRLKQAGLIMTEDWDKYSGMEPIIKSDAYGYEPAKLKRMLGEAYIRFYLRPTFLTSHKNQWRLFLRGAIYSLLSPKRFIPHKNN